MSKSSFWTLCILLTSLGGSLAAQAPAKPTLAEAHRAASDDVRVFDEHLVTLSSPFMEGRVPGSRGMEIAKEYMEFYFKRAGLVPAFEKGGKPSFRQPFPMRPKRKFTGQSVSAGKLALTPGKEFNALGLGGGASVEGELVFAGYGINSGPRVEGEERFSSFAENDDLSGKIAVVFRFEPMDEKGTSLWRRRKGRNPWSIRAGYRRKVRDLKERNAAGVIIINTPFANDVRKNEMAKLGSGGRKVGEFPVVLLSSEAGQNLLKAANPQAPSLEDLWKKANKGGGAISLGGRAKIDVKVHVEEFNAENVGGLLPGKGKLAKQIVIMGAHLDHLGMGSFGSRDRKRAGKVLHPGADDNASGSAAVIMLAERLARHYEALPDDAEARTILFIGFSAEESGLNGSRYYVNNPIRPLEEHQLMCNFDMIGRITDKGLRVDGATSGKGMEKWLDPILEASPLRTVKGRNAFGGSDHLPFLQKGVPILFSIIAEFHGDYHTPDDVSWKINREGAVQTIDLYEKILQKASTMPERIEFTKSGRRGPRRL